MTAGFVTCGGNHLAKRSDLVRVRASLSKLRDILIIDDELLDAERLTATLRVLFGYGPEIRWAATLGDAVDGIIDKKPDLIFLDDASTSSADDAPSIPLLRGAGYSGRIIVVSGQLTIPRRAKLLTSGASDVIHKDDIDSVRVAEALARVPSPQNGR